MRGGNVKMIRDSFGLMGLIVDYAMIFFFTGSAALLFFYLWRKGKLNFEETPKYEIFDEEDKR